MRELSNIGIAINPSKTVALPPKGHVLALEGIALLEGIGVRIAERGGVKVVGVPVGTDEYARESAMEIVRNEATRADVAAHARQAISQPDHHRLYMVQRISYLERVMDHNCTLDACQTGDGNALWMLEKMLDLPGAAVESPFSADGCPANQLTL